MLIVLVAAGRRHVRRLIGGLVAVIWPISLVACIYLTSHSQPWAFFSLPTRAWELLTGAALALGASHVARLPGAVRAVVGWAGLAGVVIAGVTFSDTTAFPGYAAMLPVLATAGIVAAGTTLLAGPASILRWSPLQWVGRRSYAIYLWHWPALVLVDAKWGPLDPWQRGLVVLGSVVVSAVSFWAIEDRVRHSPWLARRAWRGLALGGGLIGIGVVASVVAVNAVPGLTGTGEVAAAAVIVPTTAPGTVAPTAPRRPAPPDRARRRPRRSRHGRPSSRSPPPSSWRRPTPRSWPRASRRRRCRPTSGRRSARPVAICRRSTTTAATSTRRSPRSPPASLVTPPVPRTVALFGDSHAAQWFPALDDIAKRNHWRLIVLTKKGCPTAAIDVFSPMVNRQLTECGPWRDNVAARLAAEHPDLIVMSSYRYRQTGASANIEPNQAWRDGLTRPSISSGRSRRRCSCSATRRRRPATSPPASRATSATSRRATTAGRRRCAGPRRRRAGGGQRPRCRLHPDGRLALRGRHLPRRDRRRGGLPRRQPHDGDRGRMAGPLRRGGDAATHGRGRDAPTPTSAPTTRPDNHGPADDGTECTVHDRGTAAIDRNDGQALDDGHALGGRPVMPRRRRAAWRGPAPGPRRRCR